MQSGATHLRNKFFRRRSICETCKRFYYHRQLADDFLKTASLALAPPKSVDVLICGGGLLGTSIALHLAKRTGVKILLLEQGRLGGGGTWLSNGLVSAHQLWQQQVHSLANYSNKLYKELNEKYADIDYRTCGRLFVARSDFSLVDVQRVHSLAKAYGYPSQMLSPKQTLEYCQFLHTTDLQAGVLLQDDARLNPLALCHAMANESATLGVKIVENCRINSLKVNEQGYVYAADTEAGLIECKNFVNAAGLWATKIPVDGFTECHITIPAQPCVQSYLLTKTFDGVSSNMPVIHDLDANVFLYHHDNLVISGGFDEHSSKATLTQKPAPRDFNFRELSDDWDLFLPIMEKLAHRFPAITKSTADQLVSTAENFTPDGHILVGQMPEVMLTNFSDSVSVRKPVHNYYVAAGMNCYGATLAGGVGKLLADWIIDGIPSQDVSKIDVARFLNVHSNKQYLARRVPEIAGLSYILLGHTNQCKNARNLRASPIHQHLKTAGAVFGEIMGYERPLYFATDRENPPNAVGEDFPLGKPVWYNYVKSEYQACRERVGIMDMSNFSKYIVTSPGDEVIEYLQKMCSANIDKPVGSTIFTGMQHVNGGYVTDATVNRMGLHEFFIIAPTVQQVRVKMWLQKNLPPNSSVVIQDVTSMYTALNIVGPSSRHLLQDLTDTSMSSSDFPAFSCREINVAYASGIKAIGVTHCGELGWVLYIPNEFALHVYLKLIDAGKSYGIQHAGYYTLRQLRIEKFYVYWGMDIDWTTTPTECGRLFRVNFDKNFIGREALLAEKKSGVRRRYVQLHLGKHNLHKDPWPQGSEPIFRNNKFCGLTTTAAYGFTLEAQVCLGYVRNFNEKGEQQIVDDSFVLDKDAVYEVEVCGKRFPSKIFTHSPNLPMMSSEQPSHYRPTQ